MTKIIIVGPKGKMGKAIVENAEQNSSIEIVGAVGPKDRYYVGMDLGVLVGLGKSINVIIVDELKSIIGKADVIVDCSRNDVSMEVLELCQAHNKAFVTGTTGFTKDEEVKLKKAAETIPVLVTGNSSKLIHILFKLVKILSNELGLKADVDIIEMHGRDKLDAPSGTSKEIGKIIANELGLSFEDMALFGRACNEIREDKKIQFSSVRSGGVPSLHQIIFGMQNERLELVHHAYNMNAFAQGIVESVLFIENQKKGFYTYADVLDDLKKT